MTFLHNSEISLPHVEIECELGAEVISIGPGADLERIKAFTEGKRCIMGNLDPIEILMKSTPAKIEKEVERIMNIGKRGAGYIFNVGEMVPRDTPTENMKAMMQRAKRLST